MEKINKEQLEELLVRMFGELKLNKPHIKTYLQALEDYDVLSKEDVKMFHNYLDSRLTREEVVDCMTPFKKKGEISAKVVEMWKKDKK